MKNDTDFFYLLEKQKINVLMADSQETHKPLLKKKAGNKIKKEKLGWGSLEYLPFSFPSLLNGLRRKVEILFIINATLADNFFQTWRDPLIT